MPGRYQPVEREEGALHPGGVVRGVAHRRNYTGERGAVCLRRVAMSKAFTRESDEDHDETSERPLGAEVSPGMKNYVTPEGAARLRDELDRLAQIDRPAALAAKDARALREIDRRLAFLGRRLGALEVIESGGPTSGPRALRRTVVVRAEDGAEHRYRARGPRRGRRAARGRELAVTACHRAPRRAGGRLRHPADPPRGR